MAVALITGASSGLGEVFARKLAARGYDLILTARREDRMRDLAATLPGNVTVLTADLAIDAGVGAVAQAIRSTASLELLVNNAGFGSKGRFWEADFAQQDAMHRVHVLATLHLTRAALEGMVQRGKGAVINVSSVAAFTQRQGAVSYCATKAWIKSFTEGIAMELRGISSPVKVQALCPGYTHTDFHSTSGIDKSQIPRWLWMKADDVVEQSLKALDGHKVFVIPGWKYKLTAAFLRHVPAGLRMRLSPPGKDRRT